MRPLRHWLTAFVLLGGAACGPRWHVEGTTGLTEKYDDNLDLTAEEVSGDHVREAFAPQLDGQVRWGYAGDSLEFEHQLRLRFEFPDHDPSQLRFYEDDELYLGYDLNDRHTLSLTNLSDCFADVDDGRFDVCRDNILLAHRWAFATDWRLQWGLELHHAEYGDELPEPVRNSALDYSSVGPFAEVRYLQSYQLSYWTRLTGMAYTGAFRSQVSDTTTAPSEGVRFGQDLGLDWVGNTLSVFAIAGIEFDDSPETDLQTVDGTPLRDDDLETDAQFNYHKVRASLLGTWRLDETWTFGAYAEVINLSFVKKTLETAGELPDREDLRYLTSGWAAVRLSDPLSVKLRLTYRENRSTVRSESYQNFIGALGVEYAW